MPYSDTPKEIAAAYRKVTLTQIEFTPSLSSYAEELKLFNCVRNGDLWGLKKILEAKSPTDTTPGHMSDNPVRQAQYIVVSGITLATRYAIAGGMSEAKAFHLSDAYLQRLGNTLNEEDALQLFLTALFDFTNRVHKLRETGSYSFPIAQCIRYIENHISDKITLTDLSTVCNRSPRYLSTTFHRETGMTIMNYIRTEKLQLAAQMLEENNFSIQRIAQTLEFPSQSAFCGYFRDYFGVTPSEYRKGLRK